MRIKNNCVSQIRSESNNKKKQKSALNCHKPRYVFIYITASDVSNCLFLPSTRPPVCVCSSHTHIPFRWANLWTEHTLFGMKLDASCALWIRYCFRFNCNWQFNARMINILHIPNTPNTKRSTSPSIHGMVEVRKYCSEQFQYKYRW